LSKDFSDSNIHKDAFSSTREKMRRGEGESGRNAAWANKGLKAGEAP
jgi:hypothetical protein